MQKEKPAAKIARLAAVAAIYVVLTVAVAPIAFGPLQFRISEILVFLCFFRRDYCLSLIAGCALANLFSPFGWYDLVFGTLHTAVSVAAISFSPKLWVAGLFPVAFSFIIGAELALLGEGPFWLMTVSVMAGEALAVMGLGLPVFTLLSKNKGFLKAVGVSEKQSNEQKS